MYFKQFYLGCLAHASYLIGSEGQAAVVDPRRDVDIYLEEAEKEGLKIRYIIETHLHADFVSGHRELAELTGAEIVFGYRASPSFPYLAVKEGDKLQVGKIFLEIYETPGHTPESISVLVTDREDPDAVAKLLTGDTLFIGDVGRPDLVGSKGYTPETMAGMLYDSLHEKLLKLPDQVEIYPAHGAGSLCGRNISNEKSSTIGHEKLFNYALQIKSRQEFIRTMTTDLPEAPEYFQRDAELNRTGPELVSQKSLPSALTAQEVNKLLQQGYTVLDTRSSASFGTGHIPTSVNIGLVGSFAPWAGSTLNPNSPIIIITDELQEVEETVIRLARVGLENIAGYLDGGMAQWEKAGLETVKLAQITVDELAEKLKENRLLQQIDVRTEIEFSAGHIPKAKNIPLPTLLSRLDEIVKTEPLVINCAGGYRSSLAASLLLKQGFKEIYNLVGGFSAWQASGLEVTK
ncbi:MAG: MBL fold metallo-hydrolase [Blastocatellia bacterium]|nr:MBL fold metallo-hydrolase [Blastocatellia bacterium]